MRLVTTHAGHTLTVDIALSGSECVAVEDGVATMFPTGRLWPVVREMLPPLSVLHADPRGVHAPGPRQPGPTFAQDCTAFVAISTVVGDQVTVRTWLAGADDLWSVTPQPDGSSRLALAPEGAVADLLAWDVTAALDALVHRLENAS